MGLCFKISDIEKQFTQEVLFYDVCYCYFFIIICKPFLLKVPITLMISALLGHSALFDPIC